MNHDAMINAPVQDVVAATMKLVDRLQDFDKAIQSVAACILFKLVCEVHGLNPQDVFTVAGNMLADTVHGERPEWKALRFYTKLDLA